MTRARSLLAHVRSAAVVPALAALLAVGCGGGDTTGVDGDDTPPTADIASPSDGATIVEGSTVTFEGTAEDDGDGTLTGDALSWESDRDGELGTGTTVQRDDLSLGEHTVTLTATDRADNSGSASIGIAVEENDPPSASISSPPDDTTYGQGAPVDLEGSATDPQSGDLTDSSLTWSSGEDGELGTGEKITRFDLSVATHAIELVAEDPQGLADTATVSITVEANGQPTATIDAPSDGAEIDEGQEITFEGSGSDPEDGPLTGSSLVWSSDLDGELGEGEAFTRNDLTSGSHTVTLTATDSRQAPTSASVGLDVNGDPEASIAQPSDQSIFAEGDAVTLEGAATDPTEGSLTGGSLVWSSDRDGVVGTGETLNVSDLSAGPHTITLTATDGDGNTGSASVQVLLESPGFDIRLRFMDDFSESEQATIEDALDPWLAAITDDMPAGFPPPPDDLPENWEFERECVDGLGGIDDLAICVFVVDFGDGEGGVLARAGPFLVRTSDGTPSAGIVFVDDPDRDHAQLERIATHEVGHVLGIGASDGWTNNSETDDTRDPFFTGTNALSAFEDSLAGQAYLSDGVPLEPAAAGIGSAFSHWREANFDDELMSPVIDDGTNPLSVVSIAVLEDIGFPVDVSAAETYDLPGSQTALLEAEADARLSRPASSGENFGGGALVVGSNNGQRWSSDPESEAFTSLIRFDVPALPAGVEIEAATLTLFVQEIDSVTTGHDVEVLQVTDTWSEGSVTWDDGPAFGSSPLDTYPFEAADPTVSSGDLTSLARGWLDGSEENHGLALDAPDAESDPTFSVGYWSRTAPAPATRPRLEVEASTGAAVRAPDAGVRNGERIHLGDDVWDGPRIEVTPDGRIVRFLEER